MLDDERMLPNSWQSGEKPVVSVIRTPINRRLLTDYSNPTFITGGGDQASSWVVTIALLIALTTLIIFLVLRGGRHSCRGRHGHKKDNFCC